ncbi:MAG: trypsin-like peptidase domain-containing protein, partial [Armatimonadota bacterium]
MSFGLHVNAADCLPQTYLAPVSAASTALALAPPDSVKTSPILDAGSLTPAERSLTSVSQEPGQPLPIGIVRGLKLPSKSSAQASGVIGVGPRSLKLMRVRSTDAVGVRIHFSSLHLADGLKVILYSESSPAQVFGPYTGSGPLGTGDWWGPTIAGETVVVEVQSSTGAEPLDVSGSVDRILHIQAQSEVGVLAVSPCAVDVNCVSGWENEKKGVGYLLFIKGGQGFGCSGSLLNDTDTSDTFPYFLTAYHCVSTEAEANSLEVFWGYETSSCNGVAPSLVNWPQAKRTSVFHFINGRSWQEPDNSNDFSLLRANDVDDIKADVTYNGWTTTNPGVGASVANISHPDQSWKRIALGTYDGSDPNLTQVTWAQGIVQGGSSGSPLFNSSHEIIGQLVGKNSECVNGVPTGADIFGRFSVTHQFVRDYIDPTIRNPAVSIQSFTVSPARVLAGNPVDIVLSAKDTGAAGVGGGLSLSIPGIVQHSDASVSVVQQFNAAQVYWPGFTIHDRKYNIRTVNYLAVNDASTTWAANETKLLKISLTPAISQVLSVQGRAFVNRTSSPYSSRVLAPDLASGSPVDQQLFPVLRQPLTVIADDGYEPDDSRGAAVQIGAGSYTSMAVGQTDEDWYKITILNGCTLNASVVFVNSLGDIDISVYRGSDVSPIAISATTSNTESVQSQNAGADSLYYIRVILKSGGANTYNLTLNVACNVSSPTFSPPTGSYAMDQSVTISCATAGAVIYYT